MRRTALAAASAVLVCLTACGVASTPSTAPSSPAPTAGAGATSGTTRGSASSAPTPSATSATAASLPQLPRGGRTIFPQHRLVGFVGYPGSSALGRLGVGDLDTRAREIERLAEPYAAGRTVLPVLELIATVVHGEPGSDGLYRSRTSDRVIAAHLAAARKVKGLLLLDIQPGRAEVLDEVRAYARWLGEPDVGVAFDPEWAMGPGQVPMRAFGHTTGDEVNEVSAYLADLVRAKKLPEKVLVVHQLSPSILRGEKAIRARSGVVLIKSVDGIGSREMKESTYRKLTTGLPKPLHAGFKLFYSEDRRFGPLMTPTQVLALRPQPEYVLYE
ncbi:hypothetical protein [Humibacillus xanthopallidus]|uniref:Lipoprotein n=1 Tax=Humibacillus xanthopallidus TaxID=412689 RepID=A0A543HI70_9MICO|nr:hypothetical protein [Humibacillus xanthopallidus]TQM58021.1 hypothetical protein FBY41_3377 [Humibacillus xanthopallidus]